MVLTFLSVFECLVLFCAFGSYSIFEDITIKVLRKYHFKLKLKNYPQKIDEFIVPFCRYEGVSSYRGKNDTGKMVDTIKINDKRWEIIVLNHFMVPFDIKQ